MSFINKNGNLLFNALEKQYSTERLRKEKSRGYLTDQQIEGILYFVEELGEDINIFEFIDYTILEYGFTPEGIPKGEEEQEEE